MSRLTVSALAERKKLPVEFLRELGLRDVADGVAIPYRGVDKVVLFERTRLSLNGAKRFRQPTGIPLQPYGLDRLAEARKAGFVLLAEGESDCWGAWYHGFPVLGLPGANTANLLEREHLAGIRKVFVWCEPDAGGSSFTQGVARRLSEIDFGGEAYAIAIDGVKDLADLLVEHADDPSGFENRLWGTIDHPHPLPLTAVEGTKGFRTVESYLSEVGARSTKKSYWKGILREGEVSMLTGRAYSGKSTFACVLTRALILGGLPLLGRECIRARVGYCALERNGLVVAELFEKWGLSDRVFFLDELPAAPNIEHLAAFLEREIRTHRLEVVFIDHLQNLVHIKDSKDYSQVSNAMAPLSAIAKHAGAHLAVLHHQGKTEREGVIDVMGSEAYRAGVDALIECKKHGGQYYIRGEIRGAADLPKTRVEVNLVTGEIQSVDAHEAELDHAQAAIIEHLTDQAEPLDTDSIQAGVELKRAIVRDALTRLVDQGKLARTGSGKRGDPFLFFCSHLYVGTPGTETKNAEKPNQDKALFCSQSFGNGNENSGTETSPLGTAGTAGTETREREEF